jgi:hypothetical protein
MGDRGNVILTYEEGGEIYLYTHWGGSELKQTLKDALLRGRDRWDDPSYLARIIFSEMIKDNIDGNTGFGIAPYYGDGGADYKVNLSKKMVGKKSFEEFVK